MELFIVLDPRGNSSTAVPIDELPPIDRPVPFRPGPGNPRGDWPKLKLPK